MGRLRDGSSGFIYGVDVPRFRDADGDGFGDLRGVAERIPYIASLGAEWVWLLPFYLSERRDNGYDVTDHTEVDPRLGTLDDFDALVGRAHRYGLKIMLDLVVQHTSDRHPWFLASRRHDERYHDYYIWSDVPVHEDGDATIFPGEEDGVWQEDPVTRQFYHHRFYSSEPDLNAGSPAVREEIIGIAMFWARRGADGFRIDAAPHVHTAVAGHPGAPFSFYDELRVALDEVNADVELMAEVDAHPRQMNDYLTGRRVDAILGFTWNNAAYLALARDEPGPLAGASGSIAEHTDARRWVTFIRNADELDLEQLTDAERQEVFERFAPEGRMQLYGRGIRRGWAPMLGRENRYRMSLSLLFAAPGTPLLMHGQELGMGDDLGVDGRSSVRLAMQWTSGHLGGFSEASTSGMMLPAQASSEFGYANVSVAEEESHADSILNTVRELARVRAARVAHGDDVNVRAEGPLLVTETTNSRSLHNFRDEPERVPGGVPSAASVSRIPREAGGETGDELAGYGYVFWTTEEER
ncbi:maltose alpha-D-glucosyltransferase/ alpha-amylase [Paramicrobacterium humi]|uniref:Maltose alpha-D-glucosyltransferase/ alpha-amylase n=1 Tax=Paramicrobacterium humi TaxID=640635 RepID=A0A1H4IYS2_9MICO|nr:alpha-amylase family glycosyl hydrolase [Microbacterium humi]SEB38432.1 maltose alpha-D-glucosyltransferase/ alpha-amylase [Microbacterium humi]